MKKILCIFLFMLLFTFTSCFFGNDGVEEHTHTYDTDGFDGYQHYKQCSFEGCDRKINEEYHEYDEWQIIEENSHSKTGLKETHCTVCEYKLTVEIPEGHCLIRHPSKFPTCQSDGNGTYYECKECSALFRDETMNIPLTEHECIIPKYDHFYDNALICYTEPTSTENGKIEIKCSVCKSVESEDYVIVLPNDPNDKMNQLIRQTEVSCVSDGIAVYKINRNRLNEKIRQILDDCEDEIDELEELGAFDEKTKITSATGHSFAIKNSLTATYYMDGWIMIACHCGEEASLKNGATKCKYGKYDPSNTSLFEEISVTTSCLDGRVAYKVKENAILTALIDSYDISIDTLRAIAKEYSSKTHSFSNQIDEHAYEGVLVAPSRSAGGKFHVECKVCERVLTHNSHGSIAPVSLPAITTTEGYYTQLSQEYKCTEQGKTVYSFTDSFYTAYIKNANTLGLSQEEIDKYCTILTQGVTVIEEPKGHIFENDCVEVTVPTYDTDGYISFRCERSECGVLYENEGGETKIALPKILDQIGAYSTDSISQECFDYGSKTLTVNSFWLEDAITDYSDDMSELSSSTKLLTALTSFTVQTPKLTTHYSGDNNSFATFNKIENGKATIYCPQCYETILVAEVLPQDSELLTTVFVEGNCVTESATYYYMTKESWLDIIEGNNDFLTERVTTYDQAAERLASKALYDSYGETVPDKHDSLVRDSYTVPTYDNSIGMMNSGMCVKKCTDCDKTFSEAILYTDGEWCLDNGQYRRKYTIFGGDVFSAVKESWSLDIKLDSNVTIRNTEYLEQHTERATDGKRTITIRNDDFYVDEGLATVEELIFCVDGEKVTSSQMISEGRLKITETEDYVAWTIYLGALPGDILVYLEFE